MLTKFDYDLNIFRSEEDGQWYLHVYQVNAYQGATTHEELGPAVKLTELEANALQLGQGYFNEDDCWYGHDGFMKNYGHLLTERLTNLLDLPVYTEEVLF